MNTHQLIRFVGSHINMIVNTKIDLVCPPDYEMKKRETKSSFN